jgi:hypothetical protein
MKTTIFTLLMTFSISLVINSCKKKDFVNNLKHGNLKGLSTNPDFPEPPLDYCNDGNPVGGGVGYSTVISRATIIVNPANVTATSFKQLLETNPNSIIFLPANTVVDLTSLGAATINIADGTTISSDRGINGSLGAIIKTNYVFGNGPSFTCGDKVRFTGVRLRGGSQDVGTYVDGASGTNRIGILVSSGNDELEIDNCEITGWPGGAIYIGLTGAGKHSNFNNRIHHNYIYWNRGDGLGYGVAVDNGFVTIYKNVFMGNRHDIACSGYHNTNNTGYEAYCNTVKSGGTSFNFESHGENGDNMPNASTFFYIHHNYFIDKGASRSQGDVGHNIRFRGRPHNQCRIENNIFSHDGPYNAIVQKSSEPNGVDQYGNFLVWNNVYNYSVIGAYMGWYVDDIWLKKDVHNFMNIPSTNDGIMSTIGDDGIVDYNFGDADGNGETDIYKIENGTLFKLPYKITNGISQAWVPINTTTYKMNDLVFGHFNADNITDMIVYESGQYKVSWSCTSSWTTLQTTPYNLSQIKVGDMTGDGILDFFRGNGSNWYYLNNANLNSSWLSLGTSSTPTAWLALGWFDLNPLTTKIDVFYPDGTNFKVSYDGTSNWNNLASSGFPIGSLKLYDFDSDGITDVINPNNPKQVSLKGRLSWANCTVNNFPLSSFTYGDF